MGIDVRTNILFSNPKPRAAEENAGAAQRIFHGRAEREAEELRRRLRIAKSIHNKNMLFLQTRLDVAEEILEKHGLLDEYRGGVMARGRKFQPKAGHDDDRP